MMKHPKDTNSEEPLPPLAWKHKEREQLYGHTPRCSCSYDCRTGTYEGIANP